MNKYDLYQQSYGNDPFWREGYFSPPTQEYITLDEYTSRQGTEDMSCFQLVYPQKSLEKNRKDWKQLPGYQQISNGSKQALAGVLLGRACAYEGFQQKLSIPTETFMDLYKRCDLAQASYLAELFVAPSQQGKWIWTQLLKEYIHQCQTNWVSGILTRTTTLKPNPQQMFKKEGFQEVYSYGEDDPRKRSLFYLLLDTSWR